MFSFSNSTILASRKVLRISTPRFPLVACLLFVSSGDSNSRFFLVFSESSIFISGVLSPPYCCVLSRDCFLLLTSLDAAGEAVPDDPCLLAAKHSMSIFPIALSISSRSSFADRFFHVIFFLRRFSFQFSRYGLFGVIFFFLR